MTKEERELLLTVARVLRAQLSDAAGVRKAEAAGFEVTGGDKALADDIKALDLALAPFDPVAMVTLGLTGTPFTRGEVSHMLDQFAPDRGEGV